jgi:anion-transporting  ArsA/GET3 family ATPase
VTGKGGVGKSVVSAALALNFARQGYRTLLVELGEESFFQGFFGLPSVRFKASATLGQRFNPEAPLSVALWSGSQCLLDYALYLLKFEGLVKLFFENPISRALINVAPGLEELAVLGKATSGPPRNVGPKLDFDRIVLDCFSTGHFITLIRAPQALGEAIRFGPMGEQSRAIFASICDVKLTQFHVVSLPEDLPTRESIELMSEILRLTGQQCNLFLNRFENLPRVEGLSPESVLIYADLQRRDKQQKAILTQLKQAHPQNEVLCLPKSFALDEVQMVEEISAALTTKSVKSSSREGGQIDGL